ncbi:hypothetical protein ACQPYE_05390 [Actinosynnema sp. CA-299493]
MGSDDGLRGAVMVPSTDSGAPAFGQVRTEWTVAGSAEFEAAFGGLGSGAAQGEAGQGVAFDQGGAAVLERGVAQAGFDGGV